MLVILQFIMIIDISLNKFATPTQIYCKTLIFGGNVILAILAVKAKIAKIYIRQYYMQLNKAETDEYLRYFLYYL